MQLSIKLANKPVSIPVTPGSIVDAISSNMTLPTKSCPHLDVNITLRVAGIPISLGLTLWANTIAFTYKARHSISQTSARLATSAAIIMIPYPLVFDLPKVLWRF